MSNRQRARRPGPPRPNRTVFKPDEIEPVRINTTTEVEEAPRVPLFFIDDTEYTVPQVIPPTIGLRYLRDLKDDGRDYAVARLMAEVLGEDAFDDLSDCDQVTREQMDRITTLVTELAMGAVDEGKD